MNNKKVILVTGGSSRLGKVIVSRLLRAGYRVYATSRKKMHLVPGGAHYVQMDITSDSSISKALKNIYRHERKIDVVINNAGITLNGRALTFTSDDYALLLNINAVGPFRLIKQVMQVPTPPETVINITSLNGFLSLPHFALYSSSKFALQALSIGIGYELFPQTRVITLAPGALKAESKKKLKHRPVRERIPLFNWLLPLATLDDVSKKIENLIDAPSAPKVVLIGRDAKLIHLAQKLLPEALFRTIIDRLSAKPDR